MARPLALSVTPYKPSRLSIPPSPFSPKVPITPPPTLSHSNQTLLNIEPIDRHSSLIAQPPSDPLHWRWRCHKCNAIYPLGATQRCLQDGHFFCAGTDTITERYKTKHQQRACSSEFDYRGWKCWNTWRRDQSVRDSDSPRPRKQNCRTEGTRPRNPVKVSEKNCWNQCDFPSQCRWGKQYGVQTPRRTTWNAQPMIASRSCLSAGPPYLPRMALEMSWEEVSFGFDECVTRDSCPRLARRSSTVSNLEEDEAEDLLAKPLLANDTRETRKNGGFSPNPLRSHPPSPTLVNQSRSVCELSYMAIHDDDDSGGDDPMDHDIAVYDTSADLKTKADSLIRELLIWMGHKDVAARRRPLS